MFNIETVIICLMFVTVALAVTAATYAFATRPTPQAPASEPVQSAPPLKLILDPVPDLLAVLEGLVARGHLLRGLHALQYGESKELLNEAESRSRFVRARAKIVDRTDKAEEANLVAHLREALAMAERALLLIQAEMDGKIRYYCSVGTLLRGAASTDSLDVCLSRLREAVKQAENPDASEEPDDLARSLIALALVTWRDLKQPGEAEVIYTRALAGRLNNELMLEAFSDLTRLYADQGLFDKAKRMFHVERLMAAQLGRSHETKARTLAYHANAYEQHGQLEEAIRCMSLLRELAETSEDRVARSYQLLVLKKLAEYQVRLSNFAEAEKLYDEGRQLGQAAIEHFGAKGTCPDYVVDAIDSADHRKLMADMLEAVGRTDEAAELRDMLDPAKLTKAMDQLTGVLFVKKTALQRRQAERLSRMDPKNLHRHRSLIK